MGTAERIDLRALALFVDCPPQDLAALEATLGRVRDVPEGEEVCRQDGPADRWWFIVEGTAEVTVDGLYLAELGEGESFGELALIEGRAHGATVTASSDMVVQEVDGSRFLEVLAASPGVTLALLRETAGRLRAANEAAVLPAAPAAARRVAVPRAAGTGAAAGVLDPLDPGFLADPYPYYEALRESTPVFYATGLGAFILTRHDDVRRLTRDRSLSVEVDRAGASVAVDAEIARNRIGGGHEHRMMLRRDDDEHRRLRQSVARSFSPRAISTWRARTAAEVERLLDALAPRGQADLIADFALLLPATIISEMLGLPPGDLAQLRAWSTSITKTFDPLNTPEQEAQSLDDGRAFADYLAAVVAHRRAAPADDLLSQMVAPDQGPDALCDDDVVAQLMLLYIAGHENVLNLIGNGLTHLLDAPEQLDLLRTNRAADSNAIEELLRFDAPVQFARRVTLEPLRLHDTWIPAGSVVLLCLGAANRDPDKWGADADVLDVLRPRANEHTSFGGGPHHCLGSALSRLEAQIALPALIRRFPHMAPAYEGPDWGRRMVIRGVETLPVRLHAHR